MFKFSGVYAPKNGRTQNNFFKSLEAFLETPKTLVLLGDFKAILDARQHGESLTNRKSNPDITGLLKCF